MPAASGAILSDLELKFTNITLSQAPNSVSFPVNIGLFPVWLQSGKQKAPAWLAAKTTDIEIQLGPSQQNHSLSPHQCRFRKRALKNKAPFCFSKHKTIWGKRLMWRKRRFAKGCGEGFPLIWKEVPKTAIYLHWNVCHRPLPPARRLASARLRRRPRQPLGGPKLWRRRIFKHLSCLVNYTWSSPRDHRSGAGACRECQGGTFWWRCRLSGTEDGTVWWKTDGESCGGTGGVLRLKLGKKLGRIGAVWNDNGAQEFWRPSPHCSL